MDEKIEVNNKTVIDLAKIIHKHYQHIQADWKEYTNSDVALAYAIKWNGYRKESDTAREILAKLLNMGERAILNDIINPYECFFVSFDKFKKIAEKYGVDLGE